MNDFSSFEKTIVRELSCRLCLCTDVVKLKPLSAEIKRKLKRLFDIAVRADDTLPKAICHDCLQQVGAMHLYTVKVDKTQKFLEFYKLKAEEDKQETPDNKMHPIIAALSTENVKVQDNAKPQDKKKAIPPKENVDRQGDTETQPKLPKPTLKKKDMKFMESMPMEEFAKTEKLDRTMLNMSSRALQHKYGVVIPEKKEIKKETHKPEEIANDILDTIVLVDGRPAKQGQALDKQITLFYKMECCICHENGFHFRSLMKHYKDRHGVPGYVTCCDKKFHYFYPKKIIEHMAYHLQPHIFMCPSCHQNFHTSQELVEHQANGGRTEGKIQCPRCSERFPTYHELGWHIITHRTDKMQCDYCGKQCPSCHQNFHTSQELVEHQANGGRTEGKIQCPRCSERFPTYHELGWHIITHRTDKMQCDYCGKQLKHHHRKKTINHMEDIILCSQCIRTLRNIEKQERENKEKIKARSNDIILQKHQKFGQAMGLSGDEDASTD